MLNRVEITPSPTKFQIVPGLFFRVTISNNSDDSVELDRICYAVQFKLPLEEEEEDRPTEDFIVIGQGHYMFKDVLQPREKRIASLLFEIPHQKVLAIAKTLKAVRTIESELYLTAYFTRWPRTFEALSDLDRSLKVKSLE